MGMRNPDHLAFVRTMPCSIAGRGEHRCGGVTEPMHYRGSKTAGTGMKPGDDWTMPGCTLAHREQHQIGEKAFEKKYAISMSETCQLVWGLSPVKSHIVIGRPKRAKAKAKGPKKKIQSRPFSTVHRPLRRKVAA